MANKKAFEIQFNWLFVLVAGAAILIFFTTLVVKQKSLSETSTKATVLKNLETIIISASVSTDTTNIVPIPNSNIEVSCNRLSLGDVSRQYQSLILFSPSSIKGDKVITQTLAFSAPYRATNLLYMTSSQLRYVLIGNSNLANEINKSLPSALKKEFYQSQQQIKNSNNYKVRFIVFGNIIDFPQSLANMHDLDVTALVVNGEEEQGVIEFYQKKGRLWQSKGSSAYIGKQSLIGAVYADTKELYECSMQNTFSKLNRVTKIYFDRTKELMQRTFSQAICSHFYASALNQLNRIEALSSKFNKESAVEILESSRLLEEENKNTQKYSCPLIY